MQLKLYSPCVIDYKIIAHMPVDACSEVRLCLTSGKCPLVIFKNVAERKRREGNIRLLCVSYACLIAAVHWFVSIL